MDLTFPTTKKYGIKNHHEGTTSIQGYGENPESPAKILTYFQRRLGKAGKSTGREKVEEALLNWGDEKNLFISYDEIRALPLIADKTAEHQVYLDKKSRRAIKVLKPGKYGMTIKNPEEGIIDATFEEYLQRLTLINHIFGTDIVIDGITVIPEEIFQDYFTPTIVTSQEWHIQNFNPESPDKEISKFMREFKFTPGARTNQWKRFDGIYVADAKDENFVFTTEGPRPVDLLVSKISA